MGMKPLRRGAFMEFQIVIWQYGNSFRPLVTIKMEKR